MERSFYHFALTYRGKSIPDEFSRFADAMFLDHSFPRTSKDFENLSRYVEEKAHPIMKASTFDEMWQDYKSG
ncbi:MAG TPA: YozE family protein [Planococcus sp. (in: firmicutes)]|nr:YozE family protein [Planococcus sp. (in: firmicutes)]